MLFDTNIIIAYLKGDNDVVSIMSDWKREGRAFIISSITFSEVLSLSSLSPIQIKEIKTFLNTFISVPFDNQIGEIASYFRRKYKVPLPDAAIAATALSSQSPLVTRDHDFCKIKEIRMIEI